MCLRAGLHQRPWLLPYFAGLVTIGVAVLFFELAWDDSPRLTVKEQCAVADDGFYGRYIGARAFFTVSYFLFVISALATILVSALATSRLVGGDTMATMGRLAPAGLLLILPGVYLLTVGKVPCTSSYEIGGIYVDKLAQALCTLETLEKNELGMQDGESLRRLAELASYANALILVGMVLLASGFSGTIYGPQDAPADGSEAFSRTAELSRQILACRHVLFAGSAFLVLGVISTYAFASIPGVLSPEPIQGSAIESQEPAIEPASARQLAVSITVVVGAVMTSFLASVYLPASLFLSRQLRDVFRVVESWHPDVDRQQWLDDNQLSTSALQHVSQGLAVALPLLVSVLQVVRTLL